MSADQQAALGGRRMVSGLELECQPTDYRIAELCAALRIPTHRFIRLVNPLQLPSYRIAPRGGKSPSYYPREYYRPLVEICATGFSPSSSFIALYHYHWMDQRGTESQRRLAIEKCRELEAAGKLYTLTETARHLGSGISTLIQMGAAGRLISLPVGRRRYFCADYIGGLEAVLDQPSVPEAMEQLGISERTVFNYIACGKLRVTWAFNGQARFYAEELAAMPSSDRRADPTAISVQQAAKILRVPAPTLHKWILQGYIPSTKHLGARYITQETFAGLQLRFSTINPEEFGWLDQIVQKAGRPAATWPTKSCMLHLGVTSTTIRDWTSKKLLPYYCRAPEGVREPALRYFAPYISGLREFAGQAPVTVEAARAYRDLCVTEPHALILNAPRVPKT